MVDNKPQIWGKNAPARNGRQQAPHLGEKKTSNNSPGLAQGVSDNRLEIEIQQETRTKIIEWSNNCAIADVFVELLLFLVQLLNNSLTRGGAVREPWVTSTRTCLHFGVPFFLSVFLHLFFQHKITFVAKLHPKWFQNPPQTLSWTNLLSFYGNLVLERPYNVFTTF